MTRQVGHNTEFKCNTYRFLSSNMYGVTHFGHELTLCDVCAPAPHCSTERGPIDSIRSRWNEGDGFYC